MKLLSRGDSRALQLRIPILNTSGARSSIVRSLRTADNSEAAARSSSLTALASGVHSSDWLAVQKLIVDVFKASGVPVPAISQHPLPELIRLQDFAEAHLKRRAAKVGHSHLELCRRALTSFWRAHKGLELRQIEGHHVQAWCDARLAGASVGTVRNELAAVNALFRRAVALGHLRVNPCAGVDLAKYVGIVQREPMPDGELQKVLAKAGGTPWETAVMFGRYAGLRLADASKVSGEAVSFTGDACLLAVRPGKTERPEVLPLFGPIVEHLRGICVPGLLTPGLAALSPDRLSRGFCRLCDEAGVDSRAVDLANGRTVRRVSFHSLRHAFVTDLSRRGVPLELRKRMSAHSTDSAHAQYDHAGALDLHKQVATFFTSPTA